MWFNFKNCNHKSKGLYDIGFYIYIVIYIVMIAALSRMPEAADPSLSLSGGLRSRPEQSETPARRRMHRPQDCAVIVAWLERYEDRLEFPIRELTASLHSPVSGNLRILFHFNQEMLRLSSTSGVYPSSVIWTVPC